MKKFLGYVLLSIPFIALAIYLFLTGGMESVVIVMGSVVVLVGLILLGVRLICDD